ncbi:EF-hand [Backusella circina FSU 941]|nr:EF-hand [Backusella circina FSU 941]
MASKRISLGSHFLSTKKKDDLKDLFASFDKDCDGKISRPELEDMLHSAGIQITSMSKLNNMLERDGSLNFENFAVLMRPTLSDPLRMTKKQQELKEAFDAFDKDGDGAIDVKELQSMMAQLGDKLSLAEAQELIEEVDMDKDGVVNFGEFATMMGVQISNTRNITKRRKAECQHHHRSSIRRFFCTHK